MASFWGLVTAAAVVDAAARGTDVDVVRWLNYIFVWLAIHQLGYAWRDGTFSEPIRGLSLALGGGAALVVLEGLASYPVSMVTVPGGAAANSNPPTLALLALGMTHVGLALALEGRARLLLERSRVWTATIFVNGVIMTLYLWHATVMVLLVGIAELPGGSGLRFVPNTAAWWATRPLWLMVLLLLIAAFVAIFGRVEAQRVRSERPPPTWRSVAGAIALCVGLVALSADGIGGDSALGVRLGPVLLTLCGTLLVTVGRGAAALPSARQFNEPGQTSPSPDS
jgi:hypothetical protein